MASAEALTDAQLVADVLAGDQAQYRWLVQRHQRAVFNAAYRLLGNQEEAADITQDAFIRAYQALDSFQRDKPMTPWLCRIAINLSLNRLKHRRPTVSLDDDLNTFEIADASTEPQAQLLRVEQQRRVRWAVLALPPDQRAIIELRHFQGLSYDEIAAQMELSLASVKSRLFRARKKLRQILDENP